MASTDIGGEPILILSLSQVISLMGMLDLPDGSDQDSVYRKIVNFRNDPDCIEWEKKRGES